VRFVVTGEWDHNRLLQVVVVLYCLFVVLLWLTNWMLYFDAMDLTTASVVDPYLGNEEEFRAPRTYRGRVELAHFHLFAIGMLLLQGSLAALVGIALWSVFAGRQAASDSGADDDDWDEDEDEDEDGSWS